MNMRAPLLLAVLVGLLALPAFPALAGHTVTIKAQAQVGEWVDVSKEVGGGLGFYAILNFRYGPDPGRVLGAAESDSDKGIVRAKCARPGTVLWEIEYTYSTLGQRAPKLDRHYLRVEVTCLEQAKKEG